MEEYVLKNNQKLRRGYTTGTCAAAAAKASAMLLLGNETCGSVSVAVPRGAVLDLNVLNLSKNAESVTCCIRKDSGDDPDVTDKAEIYATVKKSQTSEIHIDGGKGVGRVTKPGLACAIGEAAINPVPRKMMRTQ
jgi:cobalt-precorrin-5B (C1)-methyltransferase